MSRQQQRDDGRVAGKAATPRASFSCTTCKLRKVKCSGQPSPCESCRRLGLDCAFPGSVTWTQDNITSPKLVSPTETQTEAGTVRRRTLAACKECRVQKAKCSGQRPRCHRCNQRGLDCVYEARKRRQAPRSLQGSPSSSTPPQGETQFPLPDLSQGRFLIARNVIARHIEAYFEFIYHLPGYDFFHRPSMLEDFHNDKLPPVLCTALCAAVTMYVTSSREARQISVQWAKDVDDYIFSNINNLNMLNLQLMMLSMFQNFAYRQFGRVWLMHGMAARLALSLQLNRQTPSNTDSSSPTSRECARRLIWGLFIHDKIHSGGVEEFVTLTERSMHIPLPMNENDFQHELDVSVGVLSESMDRLTANGLGINGYMVLLQTLRYHILKTTKIVIVRQTAFSPSELESTVASLLNLKAQFTQLYESLPPHLTLSDRNILAHSAKPEFTAYLALHCWAFQGFCDLFRICLPGVARESASADFLAHVPADFVAEWRGLTVSFAVTMARTWERLISMKASGALSLVGDLMPLSPASCVSIHQCTKILLIARTYQLYSGLVDPISGEGLFLDDQIVESLCQSNISFVDGLAAVAPVAAVVQQDVRDVLAADMRDSTGRIVTEQAPVTSNVQRERVLSRYHMLAMGIAASKQPEGSQISGSSPSSVSPSGGNVIQNTDHLRQTPTQTTEVMGFPQEPMAGNVATLPVSYAMPGEQAAELEVQQAEGYLVDAYTGENATINPSDGDFWESSMAAAGFPGSGLAMEYSIAASQYDMGGELHQFLMNNMMPEG